MTAATSGDSATETSARIEEQDPLLVAAREQFLAHGYAGTSLERIATQAGVARQTIYNRFGSKKSLFREVVSRKWASLASGDSFGKARELSQSPVEALTAAGWAIVEFVESSQQVAFTRMVIRESAEHPWIGAEFFKVGKLPALTQLIELLADMDRRGRLSCSNPDTAARQFIGMIQEFVIWPAVMALSEEDLPSQPVELVIAEAVRTFTARYVAQLRGDEPPGVQAFVAATESDRPARVATEALLRDLGAARLTTSHDPLL